MDIKEFLYRNKLKQVELANYLGVTEASISKFVKGNSQPSKENLRKILNNSNGWDVSMLSSGDGNIIAGNNNGGNSVVTIGSRSASKDRDLAARVTALEAENELLKTQVDLLRELSKSKDEQIELLKIAGRELAKNANR